MGKRVILASELGLIVAHRDRVEERHPETLPSLVPPENPHPEHHPLGRQARCLVGHRPASALAGAWGRG